MGGNKRVVCVRGFASAKGQYNIELADDKDVRYRVTDIGSLFPTKQKAQEMIRTKNYTQ